ncbi:MAG: DUF1667 domain-containing protein [Traorella sp.]
MVKDLVCIVCPLGCRLSVAFDKKEVYEVKGNSCPRGAKYAIEETTKPTRMVTSTVFIKNAKISRLPVATSAPIPKTKIYDVMKQINKVKVKAPVKLGDVIIENVCRCGVDIVATRSLDSVK